MKEENARDFYLDKFQRENKIANELFSREINHISAKLVELLKEEDLTLEQAYASLQYAYNLIKYESNFLRLK
jgi:hypothetical protein